jgi:hypothetical protein
MKMNLNVWASIPKNFQLPSNLFKLICSPIVNLNQKVKSKTVNMRKIFNHYFSNKRVN